MMFIHDKGLWNDRQTLINFIRKFLVSVREAFFELFITQSVFEDTAGRPSRFSSRMAFFLRVCDETMISEISDSEESSENTSGLLDV